MNIHHLELFYYVARHGGISEAVRNMPYGIQQPALSAQIIRLESDLGEPLFQRRPFSLTPVGETLYHFIEPFFSGISPLANELRGGRERRLRIGATEVIQRDYLPELMMKIRAQFPAVAFSLTGGRQPALEQALLKQELDLGIAVVEKKTERGIKIERLIELPQILLVPKSSRIKSADTLWEKDRIDEPLIALPVGESLTAIFQQHLAARNLAWEPSLEVSSLDLVATYVAAGFGIGLSLQMPRQSLPRAVRSIPLDDFPPIVVAAFWTGKLGALQKFSIGLLAAQATEIAI